MDAVLISLISPFSGEMKLQTTFMFVIVSSCSLVLIFYFMAGKRLVITKNHMSALMKLILVASYVSADHDTILSHFIAFTWRSHLPLRRPLDGLQICP